MALLHAARPADHGGNAGFVEQPPFRAKGHRAEIAGTAKPGNQLSGKPLWIGRQPRVATQRLKTDGGLWTHGLHPWQQLCFGKRLQFRHHLLRIEAGQGPYLEIELTLRRDDIKRRAAMNDAGLHG